MSPAYLSDLAQKSFFAAALWVAAAIHASFFLAYAAYASDPVGFALLALSIFCWRQVVRHTRQAMECKGR
jgi:lipid-A-disaccharide synthase-like uncharacterized protein